MLEKNSSLIFIVGTLHLLTPADFPLPDAFDIAYQQSDEVIFEASMDDMEKSKLPNRPKSKVRTQ
jgi:uncharacterized protein YbaP (TraB family)